MKRIRDLRGLGKKSEQTLAKVGVHGVAGLQAMGAIQAFIKLKQGGYNPSLNFLYALVGALEDRSWLDIAQHEKGALLMAMEGYQELEKLLAKDGVQIRVDRNKL
jgi:DNA transformation protein